MGRVIIKYKHTTHSLVKASRKAVKVIAHAAVAFVPFILIGVVLLGGFVLLNKFAGERFAPLSLDVSTVKLAQVPVPVPQRGYGLAAGDLVDLNATQLEARLNDFNSLGIEWVRVDMPWSVVQENGPNDYDWTNYDRVFAAAIQHNLKVLVILDYTPLWARPANCRDVETCPPADSSQFAHYAAVAVNRYKTRGIKHWEIWNEPNHAGFWGTSADAVAYTKLLVASYDAIKRQDPTSVVIAGGMSPAFTGDGDIAPGEFLTTMYKNGATGHFDALAHHPYSYPVPASYEALWSGWTQMKNLRPIMTKYGDANKLIWVTECGAPTNGPGSGASVANYNFRTSPDHVDEALQAEIANQAILAYKTYNWVGPFFWYGYKDRGTDTVTNENFFGLLRGDSSKKPVYTTLQQKIAL